MTREVVHRSAGTLEGFCVCIDLSELITERIGTRGSVQGLGIIIISLRGWGWTCQLPIQVV